MACQARGAPFSRLIEAIHDVNGNDCLEQAQIAGSFTR
jgi:hypothetical protein